MAKRLKLARKLLKDTGVIFISIDDNEQAQLKLLCDEIFGEDNFRNSIIVRRGIKNVQAQFEDVKALSVGHEHIFCYTNSPNHRLPKLEKGLGESFAGKWDTFWRGTDRPTMRYELFGKHPEKGQWRWEQGRAKKASNNYQTYLEEYSDSMSIDDYYFDYLTASNTKLDFVRANADGVVQYYVPPQDTKLVSDNWMDISLGGSFAGFQTEKNVDLIKRIISWLTAENKDALILDFFAGSGTTLHATMVLNAEDSGTRRCILVTNNENNICEQVTYERNRRVIQGYTTPKGVSVLGLVHNSLHYYRTALVEKGRRVAQKRELVRRATELLCFKDGCHFSAYAEHGALLTPSTDLCLFQDQAAAPTRYLLMVYDEAAIGAAVALLDALLPAEGAATPAVQAFVYVFADGHDPYTDDFEPVAGRGAELCAVPEALLQAYYKARTTSRAGRTVYGQ